MRSTVPSCLLSAALIALSACNDASGPGSGRQVGLGFQIARTSTASSVASGSGAVVGVSVDGSPFTGSMPVVTPTAAGLQISRDADVIVVTKAQLVVKDVKLKQLSATCVDDDSENDLMALFADGKRGSSGDDDRDGCAELHIGPYLVNVPVNGLDGARVTVDVPAGTYTSVRLSLHKVTSNDSTDRIFRQTYPDFRDISVRLEGTYNGTAFIFVSDVNAKIDVPLEAPVVIGEGGDDVTVSIDLSSWFLRPQGGLYAPSLANTPGAVRAIVQHNIRSAFRAFRDRDHDGRKD